MSKKATSIAVLGILAIFCIFLIVGIMFIIKADASINKIIEDSECAKSIKTHALLVKTTGEGVASDIYCPTKYYTITSKDDNEIKNSLAEAMKTCWGMWGRGQLNLFKDEGYYCHICSVADFKSNNKQITGFSDYLTNTLIPKGDGLTYADYLTGYGSEKAEPQLINDLNARNFAGTIDTSKNYASIFIYAKGKEAIKSFLDNMNALSALPILQTTGGGITTGFALGIVGGVGLAAAGVLSGGTAIIFAGVVTALGGVIGAANADEAYWVSMIIFTEYNSVNLKRIGCEITPVKQDEVQDVGG